MEDALITLNIGGTVFKTYRSKLLKYPNSKLGSLTTTSEHYLPSMLDYYRYDRQRLHIPNYTCGTVLLQEFDFWGLPLVNIADCCFHIYTKHEDEVDIQQNLFTRNSDTHIGSNLTNSFRKQLWLVLDQPNSSRTAQIYFAVFMMMVVLSVLMSCMITDTQFRVDRSNPSPPTSTNNRNQFIRNNSTTGNIARNVSVTQPVEEGGLNWKMKLFIDTTPLNYIIYIDYVTTGFFLLELFLHFLVCPQKKRFLNDNNNKMDVLLFFVTLLYWCVTSIATIDNMKNQQYRNLYVFANVTMMLQILRMFRLTKLYTELRILLITLQKSIKELILLFVAFAIFAVLFGNLIYYSEISESETFPDSFIGIWWSIITMTTVGYGDYVPKSSIGYFAGVITATSGVLIITMPIAIIAGKFDGYYTAYNTNKTKTKMRELQKQEHHNSVAPLYNTTTINKH
ncbi:potassium voltage-gated channel protein Shaw-like [Mytilus trossulus]|uniref:potassium voltage-gated channel protein Shaw-like n=1 Tax=Mytilus trossulus TaxID=6551 RepID=UPI003005445E